MRAGALEVSHLMEKFGIQIKENPMRINARIMKAPNLYFANNIAASVSDGSWNLKGVKFAK